MKLTEKEIVRLTTDKRSGREVSDDKERGLCLVVYRTGVKLWFLRLGARGARVRRKLGVYNTDPELGLTLEAARKEAARIKVELEPGQSLAAKKPIVPTLGEWVAQYEATELVKLKRPDNVRPYLAAAVRLLGAETRLDEITPGPSKRRCT